MLERQQFNNLPYQEKKQTLIDIFSQLVETESSFEDTIFLLQASNQIASTTLDQIYTDLTSVLEQTKMLSQEAYLQRLRVIQKEIQKDTEQESSEADNLLDTL